MKYFLTFDLYLSRQCFVYLIRTKDFVESDISLKTFHRTKFGISHLHFTLDNVIDLSCTKPGVNWKAEYANPSLFDFKHFMHTRE